MKTQKCLMSHIFCWLETSATMCLKLFLPCRYITTRILFALFICLITLSWWWKHTVQPGLCLNDLEFSEYGLGMGYWLRKASDENNYLLHPLDHAHGKLWNTVSFCALHNSLRAAVFPPILQMRTWSPEWLSDVLASDPTGCVHGKGRARTYIMGL